MAKEKPPKVSQNRVLWDAAIMTMVAYNKTRISPLDAMQELEQRFNRRRPRRARDNVPKATEQGRDDH